jgi:hypothetical protein
MSLNIDYFETVTSYSVPPSLTELRKSHKSKCDETCTLFFYGRCTNCKSYLAERNQEILILNDQNYKFDYVKEMLQCKNVATLFHNKSKPPKLDNDFEIPARLPFAINDATYLPCAEEHFSEANHIRIETFNNLSEQIRQHECAPCPYEHLKDHKCPTVQTARTESSSNPFLTGIAQLSLNLAPTQITRKTDENDPFKFHKSMADLDSNPELHQYLLAMYYQYDREHLTATSIKNKFVNEFTEFFCHLFQVPRDMIINQDNIGKASAVKPTPQLTIAPYTVVNDQKPPTTTTTTTMSRKRSNAITLSPSQTIASLYQNATSTTFGLDNTDQQTGTPFNLMTNVELNTTDITGHETETRTSSPIVPTFEEYDPNVKFDTVQLIQPDWHKPLSLDYLSTNRAPQSLGTSRTLEFQKSSTIPGLSEEEARLYNQN